MSFGRGSARGQPRSRHPHAAVSAPGIPKHPPFCRAWRCRRAWLRPVLCRDPRASVLIQHPSTRPSSGASAVVRLAGLPLLAAGIVKQNRLPPPSFGSTQIRPWWRSTIRLQIDEPDAAARVGVAAVEALEDGEDPVRVLRVDPDAVVRRRRSASSRPRARRDVDPRRAVLHELDPVRDQVLEQLAKLGLVARHGRQPVVGHDRARLARRSRACRRACRRRARARSTGSSSYSDGPDPRVGEQVVDQACIRFTPSTANSMNSSRVGVELVARSGARAAARSSKPSAAARRGRARRRRRTAAGRRSSARARPRAARARAATRARPSSARLRSVMSWTCAIP